MFRPTVLVPGGGGPSAISTIRTLKESEGFGGKIVTTDIDLRSAGFPLADESYVVPRADSEDFIFQAEEIIRKEGIEVILPTSGFDIFPYAKNKGLMDELGVILAFSDYEILKICRNKLDLYIEMGEIGFSTGWFARIPRMYPCFAKPIEGKGSRNSVYCEDKTDFEYADRLANGKMLFQEYFPGPEYSVDVLCDMYGTDIVAVPRIRIQTRGGISEKGVVVEDEFLQKTARAMATVLNLKGPSCFQFKENKDGVPMITDLNPRIGGGTVISTMAGVNIPLLTLRLAKGLTIGAPSFKEIFVARFFEEIEIEEAL